MTLPDGFRSAVESGDFDAAHAALDLYLTFVRSGPKTLADIARAKDAVEAALEAVTARRSELVREVASHLQINRGYRPSRSSNTWQISG